MERAGVARHVTTWDAVETVLLAWTLTGHIFFSPFRVGVCLTCTYALAAVALPAVRGYKIERAAVPKNLFVNPDAVWNNAKTYFKGGAPLIVGCVPGVVRAVVPCCRSRLLHGWRVPRPRLRRHYQQHAACCTRRGGRGRLPCGAGSASAPHANDVHTHLTPSFPLRVPLPPRTFSRL